MAIADTSGAGFMGEKLRQKASPLKRREKRERVHETRPPPVSPSPTGTASGRQRLFVVRSDPLCGPGASQPIRLVARRTPNRCAFAYSPRDCDGWRRCLLLPALNSSMTICRALPSRSKSWSTMHSRPSARIVGEWRCSWIPAGIRARSNGPDSKQLLPQLTQSSSCSDKVGVWGRASICAGLQRQDTQPDGETNQDPFL